MIFVVKSLLMFSCLKRSTFSDSVPIAEAHAVECGGVP